jgi:hypothetical protein
MQYLSLIALVIEIIGVGILIRDELKSSAAIIKKHNSLITNCWWQKAAYFLAKKFGSKDPLDRENVIGESFAIKLWGFSLLLVGFILQALAIALSIIVF